MGDGAADPMAEFEAELLGLESAEPTAAKPAPAISVPRPKVISAAPQRPTPAAPVTLPGGRPLPVSQWPNPEQLVNQLRAENPNATIPPLSKSDAVPVFIPAPAFSGERIGYAFRLGDLGLGYYRDLAAFMPPAPAPTMQPAAPMVPHPPSGGAPSSSSASAANPAGVGAGKVAKRTIGGSTWVDHTMAEWGEDDFRIFVGDIGNEVNDDVIAAAFSHYPSFLKAKVIRDAKSGKSKGYGFVSFKDPWDMTKSLREMQGKYVGNRPMKVRKSTWQDRNVTDDKKPIQFTHALSVAVKSTQRALLKGGAVHKKHAHYKKNKPKKGMPW